MKKLPAIHLSVDRAVYEIWPIHLLQTCTKAPSENNKDGIACIFRITSSPNLKIMGIPLFLSNYIIFDRDRGRIGTIFSLGFYPKVTKEEATSDEAIFAAVNLAMTGSLAWHETKPGDGFEQLIYLSAELLTAGLCYLAILKVIRRDWLTRK